MVFCDNIVEKNSIILVNMIKQQLNEANTWYQADYAGQYGFHNYYYEPQLAKYRYYYGFCTVKYTTTNKNIDWIAMYGIGGATRYDTVSNPVAGTEYELYGIINTCSPANIHADSTMAYSNIYAGPMDLNNGVTGYVKNICVYDVTALRAALLSKGVNVNSDENLRAWCKQNLTYNAPGVTYNATSLVSDTSTKLTINKGDIVVNNLIECDGMQVYSATDTLRNNTYFDTGIGVRVYNNADDSSVTHTRVSAIEQNSPFQAKHPYVLKITTNGEARPGAGGFQAQHIAGANKVFIEKFVAKIPAGYSFTSAWNSQGDGFSVTYLTPREGTGDWEEYAVLYRCGSSGAFSDGGHVYIFGSNNTSVTWYVAYVNNCEITGKEYLMNYSILDKNSFRIKDGNLFTRELSNVNMLPNGSLINTNPDIVENRVWGRATYLANWRIDHDDYTGDAHASFVQEVGGSTDNNQNKGLLGKIAIDPTKRYKLSYWIKCKRDMSDFYTSIIPWVDNIPLSHYNVMYVIGTKTTLTAELKKGDTQMQVASNANWIDKTWSRIGFRNSTWSSSWNDLGTSSGNGSTGVIAGTSGSNIVTFKVPYDGVNRPVGTCVVEAYDGSSFMYPIDKSMLPTDNEWKYVEGYFGSTSNNLLFDGATANGAAAWAGLPAETTHIGLELSHYENTGSVPVKFCDIKIEPVSDISSRHEQKIQINEVD